MSRRALPILLINLGGEMMYIIDQRLKAQEVEDEKASKVMNDIIRTMFNKKFIEDVFKTQELYTKRALRNMFEKLAHASIMRLNAASMDKLFDLMVMVLKYQVFRCSCPFDIVAVTLNHLDAIRGYVKDTDTSQLVDAAYNLLIDTYAGMEQGELQDIRYALLNFLQDFRIRVSMLLRDQSQNANGLFALPRSGPVPPGTEEPGIIRYFTGDGEGSFITHFTPGGDYDSPRDPSSLGWDGRRGIKLGCNIYVHAEKDSSDDTTINKTKAQVEEEHETFVPDPAATKGLELLSLTIGAREKEDNYQFRLRLFSTEEEEEQLESQSTTAEPGVETVIEIDGTCQTRMLELDKIANEMTVQASGGGDPENEALLDLLPDM